MYKSRVRKARGLCIVVSAALINGATGGCDWRRQEHPLDWERHGCRGSTEAVFAHTGKSNGEQRSAGASSTLAVSAGLWPVVRLGVSQETT